MKKFEFKFLRRAKHEGKEHAEFEIFGSNIELLDKIWIKRKGLPSISEGTMFRNYGNEKTRKFTDFSGLLNSIDGELFLDEKKEIIYITNPEIKNWYLLIDSQEGVLKEELAKQVAEKIILMKSKTPIIILKDSPKSKRK